MATSSRSVSVGTAVTEVSGASGVAKLVYLQDGDFEGDTVIYVGGSDVTTATGIKISKTNTTVFQTYQDDSLYAICSAAGGTVRVLEIN